MGTTERAVIYFIGAIILAAAAIAYIPMLLRVSP